MYFHKYAFVGLTIQLSRHFTKNVVYEGTGVCHDRELEKQAGVGDHVGPGGSVPRVGVIGGVHPGVLFVGNSKHN